jgi:hypothetical protein
MNVWQLCALADDRRRDIRRDARSHPRRAPHQTQLHARRDLRVRRQIGYLMVEAGLHLLATAGPARPEPRG